MKFSYIDSQGSKSGEVGRMKQKLLFAEQAHFVDHLGVEEEDQIEIMEDKADDEAPWEFAFEKGVEAADDETVNSWKDEDEFE